MRECWEGRPFPLTSCLVQGGWPEESTTSDEAISWTIARAFRVARLEGEIDVRNAEALFEPLRQLHDGAMVIVDLSEVSFVDSTGLTELVRLQRVRRIRLVSPVGTQPRRVLELTQLVQAIPTFDSVDEAVTATQSGSPTA